MTPITTKTHATHLRCAQEIGKIVHCIVHYEKKNAKYYPRRCPGFLAKQHELFQVVSTVKVDFSLTQFHFKTKWPLNLLLCFQLIMAPSSYNSSHVPQRFRQRQSQSPFETKEAQKHWEELMDRRKKCRDKYNEIKKDLEAATASLTKFQNKARFT